jgi:hypothetical protein
MKLLISLCALIVAVGILLSLNSMNAPAISSPEEPETALVATTTSGRSAALARRSAPVSSRLVMSGAYTGDTLEDKQEFERKIGISLDMHATFVHWGNNKDFPKDLAAAARSKGQLLVIFWESMNYDDDPTYQPLYSVASIASGEWDDYILEFAEAARESGTSIILVPFEEANGNWYPWGGTVNGNSPTIIVKAYRHIRELFRTAPNVRFGWVINEQSIPDTKENAIGKYYPGEDAVDYVGIDGFNDGSPWRTFDDIFAKPLSEVSAYRKPVIIFSFASAADQRKASWITDALSRAIPSYPEIVGWIWFNENKERDWRVDSDRQSLRAFSEALAKNDEE